MTNVEELCRYILMIRDGRVVLHGPVQDVRNQYGNARLCFTSERQGRIRENSSCQKQVRDQTKGSWKLILEDERWKGTLPKILSRSKYIAT